MSQALTANETTILKSRFGAGADGNRQRIKLTKKQYQASSLTSMRHVRSWVDPVSGLPGLLIKGILAVGNGGDGFHHAWFIPYLSQSLTGDATLVDSELIGTNMGAGPDESLGLVHFLGKWWAWYPDKPAMRWRCKTSSDGGKTWSTAATPAPLDFAPESWNIFDVYVPPAVDAIYVFGFKNGSAPVSGQRAVWYTKTTDGVTWTTYADTGVTAGGGFGYQEGPWLRVAKTPGYWHALHTGGGEVSNSIWHRRVATLGGTWSAQAEVLYTGNLIFGREGMYGFDIAVRKDGTTLDAVYQDIGADLPIDNSLNRRTSTDQGATWSGTTGGIQESSPGGASISWPDVFDVAAFNDGAGEIDCWGDNTLGAITVCKLATASRNEAVVYGAGQSSSPQVDVTVDLSDRVISVATDKSVDMDADSFSVTLHNADRALDVHGAGTYSSYMRPNIGVTIEQWHGVVANAVKTFTGQIDAVQENANAQTTTITGRSMAKVPLRLIVKTTAAQVLSEPGYVRDMGNYVYLNKTLAEVLDDLLNKSQVFALTARVISASTYVFRELAFQDGITLWDAMKRACALAGFVCYVDELGRFVAEPVAVTRASSWTFRAHEDIADLGTNYDDDETYTRVRLIGRANLGAKYLKEQFYWPSPSTGPRAIAYDALTKHVWVLCENKHLYRLNPAANMAIVSDTDLSSWLGYPDSIDVDGADNHLWIADGFDATTGANANRKYRKVDRAAPTTTLLGPFTNPDQLHVRLHEYDDSGTRRLYMTTYAEAAHLVRMNKDGTENSRVVSPVAWPMGITSDGQGGYLLTGWQQTDMFQITYAGSIVNRIQQPAKNSNELGLDSVDLGVYAVFVDNSTIVKYAVTGTPTSVDTATLAEVTDAALETEMVGGRTLEIIDLGVTTLAEAHAVAKAKLREVARYRKRLSIGVVGQAGTQKGDVVTLDAPGSSLAGTWRVRGLRSDQTAEPGTWLAVLTVEPYTST